MLEIRKIDFQMYLYHEKQSKLCYYVAIINSTQDLHRLM